VIGIAISFGSYIYSIRAYIRVEKSGLTGPAFLKLLRDDHSNQRAAPRAVRPAKGI
jgi:hypothetical protein